MTLPCPACGAPVRNEARFCPRCGTGLGAPLATGAELDGGNYRILRSISKGGMGAVYLAEDRRAFDRACIVKQMLEYYDPADGAERVRAQERFEVNKVRVLELILRLPASFGNTHRASMASSRGVGFPEM